MANAGDVTEGGVLDHGGPLKLVKRFAASRKYTATRQPDQQGECHVLGIATQCSLDRVDSLRLQSAAWQGPVVVAVLAECLAAPGHPQITRKAGMARLRELHRQAQGRVQILVYQRAHPGRPYPVNAMRNLALHAACTWQLVWILDVDCVPVVDAYANLVGTLAQRDQLCRMCCNDGAAIVIPCFELSPAQTQSPPSRTLEQARAAVAAGELTPFMQDRWPQGHRASDLGRWLAAAKPPSPAFVGPLCYEEFFEPYVIVCAALAPLFDEGLTGYGRNKALHTLQLARCGAQFWNATGACCEHRGHAPSRDFHRAVGAPTADGKLHLAAVKRQYATSVQRIQDACHGLALAEVDEALKGTGAAYWPARLPPGGVAS